MEHLLKDEAKKQPTHLLMAEEVADRVIVEFGSKEQAEFLQFVHQKISNNYECQIKECKDHLVSVETNYENFLNNSPESVKQ